MRHRHALLAAGTTTTVVAAGLVGLAFPATAATTGCAVTYTVQSQWTGGFTGAISLTNLGSAVTNWTLTFDFPDANQKVTQGWSATWSQTGSRVTAASMSWNGVLGTGGSTSIGFNGSWSGANPVPSSFALNGTTCTGAVTSPTTSPTGSPTASPTASPTTPPPTGPAPAVRVSGNKLVTASGATYRLLGVNRSSGEFACVQGKGMWDSGPVDQASVDAMKAWNIRAVRIPLNEDCWLGLSGSPSGATYQQAVKDYANLLVANGINPILDLHWTHGQYTGNISACSDVNATCQKPMPSRQYTPQFWTGVATAFKGNNAVLFDLFNEPYPDAANNWSDMTAAWRCLRDGGTCTGISYPVAGMQELVDAVRATGAGNVLLVPGLTWTNDLSQWLTYKPNDPLNNIVASWHSYNFNACVDTACWDSQIGAVAAQVPVHAGEIGQDTCAHDYIDKVTAWLDQHRLGYTAWTWNPWGCSGGNVLIQDYNGTPTSTYGEGFKAHLLSVTP
ncbi:MULTISPECIES: cellulase family glycosylhydrolase [Micromonospora]|uniref:Endoglucanase n=1 Tax=Micromonospora solifontis TaxID=2487138 RepID=A0ABX9WEN3_9ACTN|nr:MULTISPECIES: cellulase family glycosylhydrolase [Micromonospora]NES16305.1 cellulase family glycosylhydrolase [Micromonospora sp. PPF5-17B]NES38365.1 cellulase family glycosylhydrolase [Micromonospora solifontis]NES58117.1 cellulase family glycosylhydrolase [Micromonospora sp. PPF5-6]RNL95894.1 cellulose-binding protein [Micromonospora solifontis]